MDNVKEIMVWVKSRMAFVGEQRHRLHLPIEDADVIVREVERLQTELAERRAEAELADTITGYYRQIRERAGAGPDVTPITLFDTLTRRVEGLQAENEQLRKGIALPCTWTAEMIDKLIRDSTATNEHNVWLDERVAELEAENAALRQNACAELRKQNKTLQAQFASMSDIADRAIEQRNALEDENGQLQARVPAEGDVVLVPRAFIESFIRIKAPLALKGFNKELEILQACLDAPQTRVVQEGDVVIPCNLSERLHHGLFISDEGANGWWASIGSQGLTAPTREAAIDALARAIGGVK